MPVGRRPVTPGIGRSARRVSSDLEVLGASDGERAEILAESGEHTAGLTDEDADAILGKNILD